MSELIVDANADYVVRPAIGLGCIAACSVVSESLCLVSGRYLLVVFAVKGDELAAQAMGINASRVKMTAFLMSCALTSFAGCLYAFYVGYVGPTDFGWKKSADWVIMVFFGGVNSLTGSIFGGAFLTFLPQGYVSRENCQDYSLYSLRLHRLETR